MTNNVMQVLEVDDLKPWPIYLEKMAKLNEHLTISKDKHFPMKYLILILFIYTIETQELF